MSYNNHGNPRRGDDVQIYSIENNQQRTLLLNPQLYFNGVKAREFYTNTIS